jgi:hypothetical protein
LLLGFVAALITVAQWFASFTRKLISLARRIASPDPLSIRLAVGLDELGGRLSYRLNFDPETHPRLFTAWNVPLSTWLQHPAAGLASYRRHLAALRKYGVPPREDLIEKLREWSVRYGMASPDGLVRGGRR